MEEAASDICHCPEADSHTLDSSQKLTACGNPYIRRFIIIGAGLWDKW